MRSSSPALANASASAPPRGCTDRIMASSTGESRFVACWIMRRSCPFFAFGSGTAFGARSRLLDRGSGILEVTVDSKGDDMPDVTPLSDDFFDALGLMPSRTGKLPFTCPECGQSHVPGMRQSHDIRLRC